MSEWYYYEMDIEKLTPEIILALIRWRNEQNKYWWDHGNKKLVKQDNVFGYDITVGKRRIKSKNMKPTLPNYNIHITDKHLKYLMEIAILEKESFIPGVWNISWNISQEKKLNKKKREYEELPSVGDFNNPLMLLEMIFCFHFTKEEFCQESEEAKTILKNHSGSWLKNNIYTVGCYYIFVSPQTITIGPLYNDKLLVYSKKTIAVFKQLCEKIKPIRGFISYTAEDNPLKIIY